MGQPYGFGATLLTKSFSRSFTSILLLLTGTILFVSAWRGYATETAVPLTVLQAFSWLTGVVVLLLRRRLRAEVVAGCILAVIGMTAVIGTMRAGIVGAGFEILVLWAVMLAFVYGARGAVIGFAVLVTALTASAVLHLSEVVRINPDDYLGAPGWSFSVWTVIIFAGVTIYLVSRMRADLEETFARLETSARTNAQLERRLGEIMKLEALEDLAAGVAHDFGTTMLTAQYALEKLDRTLAGRPRDRELSGAALASVTQAVELVNTLRDYGDPRLGDTDHCTGICNAIRRTLIYGVEAHSGTGALELNLPDVEQYVSVPHTDLCRVILNLYTNANEAAVSSAGAAVRIGVSGFLSDRGIN